MGLFMRLVEQTMKSSDINAHLKAILKRAVEVPVVEVKVESSGGKPCHQHQIGKR